MAKDPFHYFKTSPEIIQLAVRMYVRFPLSLRNVGDLLHERGIDICHESVMLWVDRFSTYFAHKIRKRRSESMRRSRQWQWQLDEVFVSRRQAQPTSEENGTIFGVLSTTKANFWNPMSRRSETRLLR
tara:strand:+ start:589 stop:972 length:384 start_codon:yes stop_codon:yes gene_type:complete